MLDDVAGMRDDARTQHFAFRYLHALEQMVLVFVARIRCLEAERTGTDLEHVLDDLGQVRFIDARSLVYAVAGMKADPPGRNPTERRIGRFDVNLRLPLLLSVIKPWLDEDVRQKWIVHLHQNAGGYDRASRMTWPAAVKALVL